MWRNLWLSGTVGMDEEEGVLTPSSQPPCPSQPSSSVGQALLSLGTLGIHSIMAQLMAHLPHWAFLHILSTERESLSHFCPTNCSVSPPPGSLL